MKLMVKRNRIYFMIIPLTFFLMIFYYMFHEQNFTSLLAFLFDKDKWNLILADSRIPYTGDNLLSELIFSLPLTYDGWDYAITFGCAILQLTPPIFGLISANKMLKYKNYQLPFTAFRKEKYKKVIVKEMISNALKISITVFIAFVLFFWFTHSVCQGNTQASNGIITKSFLVDILGEAFYFKHLEVIYLLDGFVRFFIITFVYSIFSQVMVMVIENKKLALFSGSIYYYGLTIIGFAIAAQTGYRGIYFNPSIIMANGDYDNINSILILLTSMIPLLSLCFLYRKVKYVEL